MMYGDYDSLLILLSPPPNNVISMTAISIELFLLYKSQKAGTPPLDLSTQEPVNDIFGKPFVCDGTWRAPDSNKIFNAAIANLHTANSQKGVYHEACKDCLAIHENDWYKGCVCHSGCPRTQRSSDPTNATEYTNSKAEVQKRMPTMRRKEAHNSFLLIYTSSKVNCCHLTQFSTCNSGLSSSFLAGCFFAMMSSMICHM